MLVGKGASGGRGGLAARFLLAKTWPQGHLAFLAWTLASQAGQVFWGPRPLMVRRLAVFSSQARTSAGASLAVVQQRPRGWCASYLAGAARFEAKDPPWRQCWYAEPSAIWALRFAAYPQIDCRKLLPSYAVGAARFWLDI